MALFPIQTGVTVAFFGFILWRSSFAFSFMFPLLQKAPVWEITGAEFSKSEMHTADGISIRFPRMTRIRDDKDWKSATNLHQLKVGYQPFRFKYTCHSLIGDNNV